MQECRWLIEKLSLHNNVSLLDDYNFAVPAAVDCGQEEQQGSTCFSTHWFTSQHKEEE